MLISSEQHYVLYDCPKLIYMYLDKGDQVCECYGCLKMVIQDHLNVDFFTTFSN